jgi:hypothetical protein
MTASDPNLVCAPTIVHGSTVFSLCAAVPPGAHMSRLALRSLTGSDGANNGSCSQSRVGSGSLNRPSS